jgi:hypothetical protein
VGALFCNQAQAALAIFEQHQIFTQKANATGPFVVHVDQGTNGLPVTTHQIAHGCAFAHLRQ